MSDQAVLVGQFAKVGDLADGSIRISIDVPKESWQDFGKIYSRGAGCAIARLDISPKVSAQEDHKGEQIHSAPAGGISAQVQAEEAKKKAGFSESVGPIARDCIGLMANPEFQKWFCHWKWLERYDGQTYEMAVKDYLGIPSRKELDWCDRAINIYQNMKHEFMRRDL